MHDFSLSNVTDCGGFSTVVDALMSAGMPTYTGYTTERGWSTTGEIGDMLGTSDHIRHQKNSIEFITIRYWLHGETHSCIVYMANPNRQTQTLQSIINGFHVMGLTQCCQ